MRNIPLLYTHKEVSAMKKICLFPFLLLTFSTYCQIATWNFNGNTLVPSSSAAGATVLDASSMGLSGTGSFFTCNGDAWSPSNWSTNATIDITDNYAEYTISADTGFDLTVTGLTLYSRRSSTGPTAYSIRASNDGFATNLISGSVTTSCNARGGTFPSAITVLSGNSLSIRIYGYSASSTGNMRMDDVVIEGTVAASGGPTATFNSGSSTITETDATQNVDIPVTLASYGGTQIDFSVVVSSTTGMASHTLNTSSLSFTSNGMQNISLSINDDADDEGGTIEITIAETSGTGATIITNIHTVTVLDDDIPDLIINEILADPDAANGDANGDGIIDTTDDEFVEIINNETTDVDISGYMIYDAVSLRHTFPSGTILGAGESVVVFGGGTPAGIPGIVQIASGNFLGLNNAGDNIRIETASGTIIAMESYGSTGGDNQSLGREPDLTGSFVRHSEIVTNPVLFSPGRHNTDGMPFTTASIYIAETDICKSSDLTISTGSGMWQDITLDGKVIASFNDNGNVMGNITADVYINTAAVRVNGDGVAYMDRNIYINPSTQPSSTVDVRIYFTATELANFLAASAEASTIGDIILSKSSNVVCSGVFEAGNLTEIITPSSNMVYENGHYLEMSVSSFSGFFPHGGAIPLPVELIDFSLTPIEEEEMILKWTTANETNSDKFIIERSYDGFTFEAIGNVEAQGNSTNEVSYLFVDKDFADVSILYYRLRQIDLDGSETLSEVRSAKLEKGKHLFSISPNPTKGNLNLNLGDTEIIARVQIVDLTGKIVYAEDIGAVGIQTINTEFLSRGIYFLNINSSRENIVLKFIKE